MGQRMGSNDTIFDSGNIVAVPRSLWTVHGFGFCWNIINSIKWNQWMFNRRRTRTDSTCLYNLVQFLDLLKIFCEFKIFRFFFSNIDETAICTARFQYSSYRQHHDSSYSSRHWVVSTDRRDFMISYTKLISNQRSNFMLFVAANQLLKFSLCMKVASMNQNKISSNHSRHLTNRNIL